MNPVRIVLLVTIAAFVWPTDAAANVVLRDVISHGTANCQSALPVFDGNIRKRPKAVANEGASPAFVTCDFESTPNEMSQVAAVRVFFINRSTAARTISCTAVFGVGDTVLVPSSTKSIAAAAGEAVELEWDAANDNGGAFYSAPALSCNLAPGVEISIVNLLYGEEIGI